MVERSETGPVLKRSGDNAYLLFSSEEEVDKWFQGKGLAIGILQNNKGEWGHWDYDFKTEKKHWVTIDVTGEIEDLRVTHAKEMAWEKAYWNEYTRLENKAFALGIETGDTEYNLFIDENMEKWQKEYDLESS